jgi:hypothetical protein
MLRELENFRLRVQAGVWAKSDILRERLAALAGVSEPQLAFSGTEATGVDMDRGNRAAARGRTRKKSEKKGRCTAAVFTLDHTHRHTSFVSVELRNHRFLEGGIRRPYSIHLNCTQRRIINHKSHSISITSPTRNTTARHKYPIGSSVCASSVDSRLLFPRSHLKRKCRRKLR